MRQMREECTLVVNGTEIDVGEVEIVVDNGDLNDPDSVRNITFRANGCAIPTEDVGELLASLMVSEAE